MNNRSELELLLKEEKVKYSIEKSDYFVSTENSRPIESDYKHNFQIPSFLQKTNINLIHFSPNYYILGNFSNILELPKPETIKNMIFEFDTFTSLSPLSVVTKSSALMLSYYSGMINEIANEKTTLTHTGMLPQHNYNFFINSFNNKLQRVSLRNFSSYVDGVFEGPNKIVLVFNELYKTEDISLKDLFLPYLYWKTKTGKEIIVIFLSLTNDIYNFYEVSFDNPDIMNSATVTDINTFKISNDNIIFDDIINLINNVKIVEEKEIPFPQANDIVIVIDLVNLLNDSEMTLKEITSFIGYDIRQSKYYTDAAIYLGLIEVKNLEGRHKVFTLTNLAKEIVTSRIKEKYMKIAEKILEHRVFYEATKIYITTSEIPTNPEIVKIMKKTGVYNLHSESTFIRRASTVQAWIKWLINLPKTYY